MLAILIGMDNAPTPPSDPSETPGGGKGERSDCFAPPAQPCECYCLHCNRVFMSDGIWFQKVRNPQDGFDGFWMCPTPNCGGAGYTFDIFPTDPNHPDNSGWTTDDGEEGEAIFDEDIETAGAAEYDPAEPKYTQLDEQLRDESDDDIEGEEWKHGLQPGERPAEPPWAVEARQHYEEEQKKYNAPDQRPREVEWTEDPKPPRASEPDGDIEENDIPF